MEFAQPASVENRRRYARCGGVSVTRRLRRPTRFIYNIEKIYDYESMYFDIGNPKSGVHLTQKGQKGQ